MSSVYLGVHMPPKPYQKILIENFNLDNKTEQLKSEACKAIDVPAEEIEFIYCGDKLNNEETLNIKGIRDGSMIHVILKAIVEPEPPFETFTETDVQEILGLWRSVDASNFQKCRQIEFVKNVLDAHPEIRGDLWTLSMLKDPILLSSMQQPETIRNVAEKHRLMIGASKKIVELLNSKKISKTSTLSPIVETSLDDPLSDSSSSDDNVSPSTSAATRTARRITTDQLASALANAGTSYNSLSNISQRNVSDDAGPTQPSTSTAAPATRITSSMFMNALSEVMMNQRRASNRSSDAQPPAEPMDTTPAADADASVASEQSSMQTSLSQYTAELSQMRELGLNDMETNLQALMVCSGNVEQAINLVFSGMNN